MRRFERDLSLDGDEVAVAFRIHFEARAAVGAVHKATVGRTAVRGVERHRRETCALVRFPFVDLAVLVAVLLGADEYVLLVVLEAVHLAVAAGRPPHARDRSDRESGGEGK